ncbi:unnamed protein product [Ceutorhynchus assimilis]|uniref:Cytochrome P450 n=1 Tax=Ceutorhynchus assimilis TaxID=467358 RepID=A0A9N9Q8P9_9CUCU|nr:unnamed protein product [Ceutorhynchus assimilis]
MDVLLIILTIFAILALPLLKKYIKNKRISKYIDHLPGEKWYPIVGTSLSSLKATRENYFDVLKSRHPRFGPFIRLWLGSVPVVQIYKPEHAQEIFKSNKAISKGSFYKFLYPWLGQGLISGSGPKWREHRKIITPSFHFKVLDSYGEIFARKSKLFADYLQKYDGKGYFEVTEDITRIAMDIIVETAMGVKLNYLQNTDGTDAEYANAIIGFGTIVYKRLANPLLRNDLIFKLTGIGKKSQHYIDIIHSFNAKVIQTRKELLKDHKNEKEKKDELGRKVKMSFLDMLLAQQEFGDDEVEEEVNTFMFGGQDTTISSLTYTFLALGNNPDILRRVQEELDQIFIDDPDRPVTPADLAQMYYLDMVFKEVLRCYCFVPFLARELHDDILVDGVLLPKGANVTINLYDLHHDPDHYPDPYKFDPDRFLPDQVAQRHPYAFAPFSAGPRNCLGQKFAMRNVKTLLATILRQYNIKCQEKPEEVKYYMEIVLRPQNGLHIALESRSR